jgi:outer membrane protein
MAILSQALTGCFLILGFLILAVPVSVRANETGEIEEAVESPSQPPELTLEMLLKNTLARNGQIQEVLGDVEIARAQVDQARAATFPHGQALFVAAPIFGEHGDALHSTSNWNQWGPQLIGSAQLVQPIYSFGMLSNYRKAADSQVEAKLGLADMKRDEIVLTTKQFYYSYLMATELEALVDDLVTFLKSASDTAERTIKAGRGGVKQHDLYRLQTAMEDLRQRELEAKAGRQTAEKAISWISTTQFESLQEHELEVEEYDEKKLEEYIQIAKLKRPEFRAIKQGQEARTALRDAKRAQSFPLLFVGAFATIPWSPVRDRQPSAYAYDPYNQIQGGVGLGLKFDLEFTRHSAEASEQEGELMKLKATESYAAPGVELEVKKAYWEFEQARDGLEIATNRRKLGKKWFVSSAMGWSVGLTPAKDLLEALEGEGLAKRNYIETVFNLNMSLARLSKAVGQEVTHLKYK